MTELGQEIAAFLLRYPAAWPLYLIGLWFVVIKPVLNSLERERLDKHVMREIGADRETAVRRAEGYSFSEDDYNQLIEITRQAWMNGEVNEYAAEAKEIASKPGSVRKMFDSQIGAIAFAFKDQAPKPDEFLIAASDSGVRTSYVLTNKYFYFFGLDAMFLADKRASGKIAYEAIDRIFSKSGFVMHQINIRLKSGERILVKDLMRDDPSNYINFRLKREALTANG